MGNTSKKKVRKRSSKTKETNNPSWATTVEKLSPVIDKNLNRLSRFLYKVVGQGAEQLGGTFSDWAAVYRQERALALASQSEMDDSGSPLVVPLTHEHATIDLTNTGRALLSACKI